MICETCQKDHLGEYGSGRFCSEKCSRSFSTKSSRKEISEKVSKKLSSKGRKCNGCGTKFVRDKIDRIGQYCETCKLKCKDCKEFLSEERLFERRSFCLSCSELHRNGVTKDQKLLGLKYSDVCPFEKLWNNEARKKRLIKEVGRYCWQCERVVWENKPIPIELDHINGDKLDNRRENCRLLCPNCHALTPTWKWRNRKDNKNTT